MAIKLIGLDIDGTLLNSQGALQRRTREAVRRAAKSGIHVVLVTGRRFHAARPVAFELELQLPLVTHNGALTKDAYTLEVLDYHPLDTTIARNLVVAGRDYGADTLCCDLPESEVRLVYERISEDNPQLKSYIKHFIGHSLQVTDLAKHITTPPVQVFYVGRCSAMEALHKQLYNSYKDEVKLLATVYPKHDMTILDAIHPRCSKAVGLAYVANSLGLDRTEVMAIGDNLNDLEMLQYAGLGVIMANSEPRLKHFGFIETASNDEDGVAEAIEKFVLTEEQNEICSNRDR
ncbi:MAG: Cof-type HAD-IIB family hydrolase [Acidobacteriota bacterium]|nr:Cof-type HAD-IIB family hydrolase [Blastocatellia bacterium]MDW8413363.1 Cof-type HAD-IIB family hydrolase [Acidobacteriota bacterium]